MNNVDPLQFSSFSSMGFPVFFVGSECLSRRWIIQESIPGVGLQIWEVAIPFNYEKKLKREDQIIESAPHGLRRVEAHRLWFLQSLQRLYERHGQSVITNVRDLSRWQRLCRDATVDRQTVEAKAGNRGKRHRGRSVGALRLEKIGAHICPSVGIGCKHFGSSTDNSIGCRRVHMERECAAIVRVWRGMVSYRPGCCRNVPPGTTTTPPNPEKGGLLQGRRISTPGVCQCPPGIGWAVDMTVEDRADIGN